jgi:diguanylate cyclase (GGDEF)-like protein
MAHIPSGEGPANGTDGAVEGQHERFSPTRRQLDPEKTIADAEQTVADAEQTVADAEQSSADSDQTSADRDQIASDCDQAASDRDLAGGVDPCLHELSRDLRQRSAREREHTAAARLNTADQRDANARNRDLTALARDQAAAARDVAMSQHDKVHEHEDSSRALTAADLQRAADLPRRAAHERAEAAEHRALAAEDRRAALADREQAARDRRQALADRRSLARQLAVAETDALTGVRTRAAGLTDLDHELDRCRRNDAVLVVAYVDVVGLKVVNDTAGHGEGDALLKRVVGFIRSHLRSYDLIIRLGGDEFLCAMSNMTLPDARERFGMVARALTASADGGAIRAGFAELADHKSAAELIARADAELLANRPEDSRQGPGDAVAPTAMPSSRRSDAAAVPPLG